MLNINEVIREIYKDLYCPVCGKKYRIGELKIRGIAESALAIQTSCSNGHSTLFMTTLKKIESANEPISADDCIKINQTLRKFNGDFEKQWK